MNGREQALLERVGLLQSPFPPGTAEWFGDLERVYGVDLNSGLEEIIKLIRESEGYVPSVEEGGELPEGAERINWNDYIRNAQAANFLKGAGFILEWSKDGYKVITKRNPEPKTKTLNFQYDEV